jgi:16S rRNA (guanine527-N7)-methyltransferase
LARALDRERLATAIGAILGRAASSEDLSRFARYAELLLLWNRTHRITALESAGEVFDHLFRDSLLVYPLLPARPLRAADLGSGTGSPGVPLRIVDPGIGLTLIESRRKRVSFLRMLQRGINLDDIRILHGRAEDLLRMETGLRGSFDVVLARAVGPAASLVQTAMGYLKPGGLFIASAPVTLKAQPVGSSPGGLDRRDISFPALGITRSFLVSRKES